MSVPTIDPRAEGSDARRPAAFLSGEFFFCLALTALGVVWVAASSQIEVIGDSELSPRDFPVIAGVGLTVVGLLLMVQVARGRTGAADESEDFDAQARTNWILVIALAAIVVIHSQMIATTGWPIAAVFLFCACAFALGNRQWVRTVLIAVVMALALQYLFAHVMGLGLPAGPGLEGISIFHG